MSAIKGILGFLVGLMACGVLLFLVSVRSPMSDVNGSNASTGTPTTAASNDTGASASGAQEPLLTEPVTEAEPTIDLSDDEQKTVTEEPMAIEDPDAEDQTLLQQPGTDDTNQNPVLDAVIDTFTPKPESQTEPANVQPDADPAATEVKIGNKFDQGKAKTIETVGTLGSSSGFKSLIKPNKTETETTPAALGAFEQNTQPYAEPRGSVLSVILIDVGSKGLTRSDLLKAEFPVTIALNPDSAGVARAAAEYYNAGFEVLIQNPPRGELLIDEPDDLAVAARLDRFIANVPKAVGFVDNAKGSLQKTRAAQTAVLDKFSETGHAVLSYKRGLDSTPREAAKRKVPSGTVFRILDGNGEKPATIERYLSRAVLEANQEGSAIVMGTATKETLKAVQDWLNGAQAANITVAPVSAAIRAQRR